MNATVLPTTPASVAGIAARTGFKISSEELDSIAPLVSEFARLRTLEDAHSRDAACVAHTENLRKAELDPEAVTGAELDRDQVIAGFREKVRAVRRSLKTLEPQAAAACEPILRRFRDATRELGDECQQREQELAGDLQIPFEPSPALRAIRAREELTARVIESAALHGGADPARALAGLLPA
jgi:aminoglycoside phosphotransferase